MNERNTFILIEDVTGEMWQVRIGAIESYELTDKLAIITTHDGMRHIVNRETLANEDKEQLASLDAITEHNARGNWLAFNMGGGRNVQINLDHVVRFDAAIPNAVVTTSGQTFTGSELVGHELMTPEALYA